MAPRARRAHGPTVVVERGELARRAAAWVADTIHQAVDRSGSCALALAGGETPRPVYVALAQPPLTARIPWSRVHVFFGDERAVPPDDPRSNYRMACDALLSHVPISPAQVHRMEAERHDRTAAARAYERLLPAHLDLLLLGAGADGHTASLFPRSAALAERERRVVPVTAPQAPEQRLTITPPVIAAARQVAVVVAGVEKARAVARALTGPMAAADLPIQLARDATWFLDRDAAALLDPDG